MELIFLVLTIIGIIVAVIFGYLQVVVPFVKGEVKLSKKFPFLISTESAFTAKIDKETYAKQIEQAFPTPENRTPIAVMPFKNQTGDSSFDYLSEAIPNLLITNLEQSKYLSVMTWERMQDLLYVLGKKEVQVIDDRLGFELCKLDGVNNIVLGSFTKAGNMFATDLKVLDVSSKQLLKTTKSKGKGIDSILENQIDELSMHIAHGVGLSQRKIDKSQLQIAEVTTTSIDAYNYFLRGRQELAKSYHDDARKFFEKAIEIDSTFASAYHHLAWAYAYLGDYKATDEARRKAKALSEKTTEKERLYIEADYASHVEGSFEKRVRIHKQLAAKYPKEKMVHCLLGYYYYVVESSYHEALKEISSALDLDPNYGEALNYLVYTYAKLGDFDKAIEYSQRYATVLPGEAKPFDSMGDLYFQMGQLDEALTKYKAAIEVKPDFWHSSLKIAYVYALRENYAEAMKWIDHEITHAPSSGVKWHGYRRRAFFNYLLGSCDQSLNDLDMVKDLPEPGEWEYPRVAVDGNRGWMYYNLGEFELSRNYFEDRHYDRYTWDSAFYTIDYNLPLGLIDIKQNKFDAARTRLATINTMLRDVTPWNKNLAQLYHDFLYAEVAFAEDSLEKAIAVGERVLKLEIDDAYSPNQIVINHIKDVVARAYLMKGDIDRAIREYAQLIDSDPIKRGRCLIRPTWHYELAKLYEEKGLKAQAIERYDKFLQIWKGADADQPELSDAKKRLASLQKSP